MMLIWTGIASASPGHDAYEKGNYTEAFKIWKHLAEEGNADAQHNLGHLYAYGYGVLKDRGKAEKLFEKAAHQGLAISQYTMLRYSINDAQDLGLYWGVAKF